MSLVVGLAAVALSTVHLSTRLAAVSEDAGHRDVGLRDESGQQSIDRDLLPGGVYRLDLSEGHAPLPQPPQGCRWRVAVVSHAPCDAIDEVTLEQSTSSTECPGESRLSAWRSDRPHRVARPVGRMISASRPAHFGTAEFGMAGAKHDRGGLEFDLAMRDLPADDPRAYSPIQTDEVLSSSGLRVVLDTQCRTGPESRSLIEAIRAAWFDQVAPAIEAQFTRRVFDAPVTIVLTPALGQLREGKLSLDGMVRPDDLRRELPRPYSAGRPVIYLNSHLRPDRKLVTILAHEAMHLACAQVRLDSSGTVEQELWLNEGLAHLGERITSPDWSNLGERMRIWSQAAHAAPLVLDPDRLPARWRDPGCRGAAYLFTDWAARVHGPGFVEQVCESPDTGLTAVCSLLGQPTPTLLESWSLACLLVGCEPILDSHGIPPLTELPLGFQPRRISDAGTYALAGSAVLLMEVVEGQHWTIRSSGNVSAVACAVPAPIR